MRCIAPAIPGSAATSPSDLTHKEFWALDLESGRERQLTAFGRAFTIGDFDVSSDGREIVFDRTRDESDIVLIELHKEVR